MTTKKRIAFRQPPTDPAVSIHHEAAAKENIAAVDAAIRAVSKALDGSGEHDKVLLRAAAGAGKSFALRRIVREALDHASCERVAVTAFANKQVFPLAAALGQELGQDSVCLFVSAARFGDVPDDTHALATVVTTTPNIPAEAKVVLATSHKFGAVGERARQLGQLGPGANGDTPFDLLLVDEAWQLPLHRFRTAEYLAPVAVGVGDVGQLPPIDPSQNPWRGDPGYNPYRAWPTQYEGHESTFAIDLPAVWRPNAAQLPLWRAFYEEWDPLYCIAAPEDRSLELPTLHGVAADIWRSVATGAPTLIEVEGLEEPDAPDIDAPLLAVVEDTVDALLAGGFEVAARNYDDAGAPSKLRKIKSSKPAGDPLIAVLATRNQAVDDATAMVERLTDKHGLPDGVLVASTVDSWQGQTNAITVALHPLSGASKLDEFNSAFGRLAVTCTRATHGLLLFARSGLDELLATAPPRPGTPFGEPGTRALPRQTHQRILQAFARGTLRP